VSRVFAAFLVTISLIPAALGKVDRIVILKVDGLPDELLEKYVNEPAGAGKDGRNRLPWIDRVFQKNGVWMGNYYSRGLSLSAPSWSILDTGRHLDIRGNSEFDRYTLRPYDYLNFFPFYLGYARKNRVDMPGVEVLDEDGVPLLIDRFRYDETFQGFQLYQRGVSWTTLRQSLKRTFTGKPAKELFDEWQTGFSMGSSLYAQTEQELITNLNNPRIRYLDYFTGEYDHAAHLTNDRMVQLHALEGIDALVGRIWDAIGKSPLPQTTVLVMVSDHGMNTSEEVFSQGYNLVDWFNSAAGGGQHVLTNRHPSTEFKLKGLDPLVSEVITPSPESTYLAGEAGMYPTVMLDLDGNERASIGLRNNTLNKLQVLLDQILRKQLNSSLKRATAEAFVEVRERVRADWAEDLERLGKELVALEQRITEEQAQVDAQPKKWTAGQRDQGLDKVARRSVRRIENWREEARRYMGYKAVVGRLLAVSSAELEAGKVRMEDLIPRKSLGPSNSREDLENYVVGPAMGGLVMNGQGGLDLERSFRTVNYPVSLSAIRVRNNTQAEMSNRPVDFIAMRDGNDVVLWSGPDREARVETRRVETSLDGAGQLWLRYLPKGDFKAGLPLELWEDPELASGDREGWLKGWHSEREWFRAVHGTRYSNGIIDVVEALVPESSKSVTVLDQYRERKRRLREVDMIVFAGNHWNFNVRGFNPGGNHGAFFQTSTHAVMLFAGGGVPKGLRVEEPYDGLSLVPTLLTLMGRAEEGLPGPVIEEVVGKTAVPSAQPTKIDRLLY
jgi:hypothetical protein